jgi:hypothetical protein
MSNVLSFPKKPQYRPVEPPSAFAVYEFSGEELAILCRWYSAMKFAFPQVQGVMTVCHKDRVSAVGLYGNDGCSPNCLISKHEMDGQVFLLWATDHDQPRVIAELAEITDAQIGAIAPPRDEASWLDLVGWMKILSERTAGDLSEALSLTSHPA